MNSGSIKLTFLLTEEQAGPFPVSTESLWCDKEGVNYRIKNIPFFIDDISFDDLIAVSKISADEYEIKSIVEPSDNSTLWLYVKDFENGRLIIERLVNLGCGVESGVFEDYYATNVPATVSIEEVYEIVLAGEKCNYIMADYPSIRKK